jgi:GNAT superfamily N-acetyltransferase
MHKMIQFIKQNCNHFSTSTRNSTPIISISDFTKKTSVVSSYSEMDKTNITIVRYYDTYNKQIAGIRYNESNGWIGFLYVAKPYRNIGIGKQILQLSIDDIKNAGGNCVWTIAPHHHVFWSNVFNKSFVYKENVSGTNNVNGFISDIENIEKYI